MTNTKNQISMDSSSPDLEKGISKSEHKENVGQTNYDSSGSAVHSDSSATSAIQHPGAGANPLVHAISLDGELVHLGDRTYRRADLANAFAGELNPGIHLRAPPNLANPVPLGLASFSYCCLVLSLINAQVRGVTNNAVLVGGSFFFGGAIELFAGLLCYPIGNTYALTVFGAYGGFWISYGCIQLDQFGIAAAYADAPTMYQNAVGFYLTGWLVFTTLMLCCTLKSTWGLFLLFFFLEVTFFLLVIGTFIGSDRVTIAGGYFGIFSSLAGWYSLYSGVADETNSYFPIKAYFMPNAPTV